MKEQIKQALEKADAGPWMVDGREVWTVSTDKDGYHTVICKVHKCEMEDARLHLIANAPEWLRMQNERIEQLEKALDEIALYDRGEFEDDYYDMQEIAQKALGKEN